MSDKATHNECRIRVTTYVNPSDTAAKQGKPVVIDYFHQSSRRWFFGHVTWAVANGHDLTITATGDPVTYKPSHSQNSGGGPRSDLTGSP